MSNVIPHDLEAEQSLLATACLRPEIAAEVGRTLAPEDFYHPQHQAVWAAFRHLQHNGSAINAVTLHEVAKERFGYSHDFAELLGYTFDSILAIGPEMTDIVLRHKAARDILALCAETIQSIKDREDPYEAGDRLSLEAATLGAGNKRSNPEAMPFEEIQCLSDTEGRFIISTVITDDTMMLIVAAEGLGKATWMRQIGMCAAQGIHPFTRRDIEPIRVLYVDLENPLRNIISPATHLQQTLMQIKGVDYDPLRFQIWRKKGGINILKARDCAHLEREIAHFRPQLVLLGPLARLYRRTSHRDSYEDVADRVIDRLAYLRAKYEFGLVIEHHAPKGHNGGHRQLDPMGSQRWMGTPDIGITMERNKTDPFQIDIGRFRDDRFEVKWPTFLQRDPDWVFTAVF